MLNKGANGKLECSQVLREQEALAATFWFSPHLQGIIPWAQQKRNLFLQSPGISYWSQHVTVHKAHWHTWSCLMHPTEWVLICFLIPDWGNWGPEKDNWLMCFCGFAREVGFKSSDVRSPCSMVQPLAWWRLWKELFLKCITGTSLVVQWLGIHLRSLGIPP